MKKLDLDISIIDGFCNFCRFVNEDALTCEHPDLHK